MSEDSGHRTGWFIGRVDIGDYMHRWLLETPWFTIRLHHIMRSDDARALHDHPWDFASLILWGGYTEVLPTSLFIQALGGEESRSVVRRPGSIVRHDAVDLHRIVLHNGPAWTLVLTGPRKRRWGFRTKDGWLFWRDAAHLWTGGA